MDHMLWVKLAVVQRNILAFVIQLFKKACADACEL